ncbi:hypothetical protein Rsub_08978 [Raphidocelis subcapitata]|uniref:Peptidase M14 carboxypeptidase A domain-containing protein n=1 Tax=Raphidocelis subcapitata TaxID=307507 RepID=A0A2V0PAY9_9CHLO|nr:hypothetical protein Rsub_08978 [Raphidocelis subcapitata]|eukprot:GBF96102.1 hypothetical protein Rsub_08978 [Raphidocelis subcapitata]
MAALGAFPTLAELDARTQALVRQAAADPASAAAAARVEVTPLGRSRSGHPISLVSLGDGPRSALVVGAPHPNEPVGCAAIEALIDRLLAGPAAWCGHRWHFIKAIDADGLRLNEGWLKSQRAPADYFRAFFRPAFARQPEYSFPLAAGARTFDAPTAENLCWQRALELTRPQLQVSLHNADVGGAFYLVSRDLPGLAAALAAQPAAAGLTLNTVGEPFEEMPAFAPGVFGFPDTVAMAAAGGYSGGDSSARFAATRYGTFSLVCEVPMWDDPRLRDAETPLGRSERDIAEETGRWAADALSALAPHDAGALAAAARGGAADAAEVLAALEEERGKLPAVAAAATRLAARPGAGRALSNAEAALREGLARFAVARPLALLARLARAGGAGGAAPAPGADAALADAEAALAARLAEMGGLAPVPLEVLVSLQVDAVLTTARALADGA